ncbi:MAG: helix-turn-helix transcriptional regulator [Bacilli bacterium]|nr:helix-turn-helix transcriptional regulator [Bacilli bacterium]
MNLERLQHLRVDNDLYQKDIAKLLDVNQQTYSAWESGNKIIPLKRLNKICNYFNISMDYVLNLSDVKMPNNNIQILELDKNLIGERLKIIRSKYKLTLREIASELNTTSSTISAYETGKTLILTAFAYQICKKYHISIDWLCGKSDVMIINKEKITI